MNTPGTGTENVAARHYGFLLFLTLLNVMNIVDRQLLASFAAIIVPDLGLSNFQFGLLTGFAFITFYSVMGLFAGALADMVHRPRLLAGALTLWSALTAASGLARGFVSLLIPRMFIGVGESVMTPSAISMLSDRFPASRMGFASGFYYMGVPIGVSASLLIVGYLDPLIGWRGCFFLLGGIGLPLAALLLLVRETPRRRHAAQPEGAGESRESGESGESGAPGQPGESGQLGAPAPPATQSPAPPAAPRQSFREIAGSLLAAFATSRVLVVTILGGMVFHFVLGATAFDQLWLVNERGFDKHEITRLAGWIGGGAGVLGNLFGGFAGDWWQRRMNSGRPMFLFWLGLVFFPIGLVYRLASPDSPWFWVGLGAGFFQLGCFYGPTFATVQELAPQQIRATVVAFYLLALNFFGLGIGITGGGIMADMLTARGAAEPYTITLVSFTLVSALSIPCYWYAGRHFFADRKRLYASLGEA